MARTITRDNLGAWLIKAAPDTGIDLPAIVERGGQRVTSRCVARGYRSRLMAEGDVVLLWVSGDGRRLARGIWGVGHVVGPVHDDGDDTIGGSEVPLDIPLLADAVPAGALVAAGIDDLEVQRMPQGSNPSWVSKEQLARIAPLLPPEAGQVVAAANWAL
ncbi:hypothetical protein [Nocardioides sp. LHG3406-4]|uniref:hypothetical protein n=1 Tax=Nocardioides sp. LHG3406-4 TaxID=2804575 RepID=UPI003CEDDB98